MCHKCKCESMGSQLPKTPPVKYEYINKDNMKVRFAKILVTDLTAAVEDSEKEVEKLKTMLAGAKSLLKAITVDESKPKVTRYLH